MDSTIAPTHVLACPVFAVLLAICAGCGHVDANYPETRLEAPKELPDRYMTGLGEDNLVWREEGKIHGFLVRFETCADLVERMRGRVTDQYYLGRGPTEKNKAAARIAEAEHLAGKFSPMAKAGQSYLRLRVFVAPGFEQFVERGGLVITFTDNTSAVDDGLLLFSIPGNIYASASTHREPVVLTSKDDPDMKGQNMYVFLPPGHFLKSVDSVARRRAK